MPADLSGDVLTESVVASFATTHDERHREIFVSLTRHLHAFVREIKPSIAEWQAAIDYLTATGHMSSETRQEFILLSDVLGVSMLVETLNDAEVPDATDSTVLGPFHMVKSPSRKLGDDISPRSEGDRVVVRGRVTDLAGRPLGGAVVDVWQADAAGFYDVQEPDQQGIGNGRGLLRADEEGAFWFRTVVPRYYPIPTDGPVGVLLKVAGRHPNRPAHIHFLVDHPDASELTTHVFVAGSPYIESDAVFAVKSSLVTEFAEVDDSAAATQFGVENPFREAVINLVLRPSRLA